MTGGDLLNQSIDKVVKRYSSLFELPSSVKVFMLLAISCLVGGILSTIAVFPLFEAIVNGLFLGFSLLFVNLGFDYIASAVILRQDPIYDFRRTSALSFFCWILWIFFISVGTASAILLNSLWLVKLSLFGFAAVIILRLLVLNVTSSADYKRLLAASLLQPFSCLIPLSILWGKIDNSIAPNIVGYFVFSLVLSILSSFTFVFLLNRVGKQTLGVPSLSLFKAFLLNWIVNLNTPFEILLEKIGKKRNVEISIIKFDTSKPEAVIVVPSVHPGPFKNVGSSLLPSMLKNRLEKELNCVACVPHGLLGHELDLASQSQNEKIIANVIESMNFEAYETKASPFTKISNDLGTACCQVFGKSAFLSITLAPKTTEDFPQELGLFVQEQAEKNGLAHCTVVNAHNSIGEMVTAQEEALKALKVVAANCLERIASLRRLTFEVGASTVVLKDSSLKDGMGPGGITVIVVKVREQKAAYVVIDGNNMVSGLRESILSSLQSMGINDGEVFTTDTHAVNAIILSKRGYHPVGEVIEHERLISCIEKAASAAMSNLRQAKAAACSMIVPDVKVIGEKKLQALCLLVDRTIKRAKKIVIPIFAATGLLLMLFLMLI